MSPFLCVVGVVGWVCVDTHTHTHTHVYTFFNKRTHHIEGLDPIVDPVLQFVAQGLEPGLFRSVLLSGDGDWW